MEKEKAYIVLGYEYRPGEDYNFSVVGERGDILYDGKITDTTPLGVINDMIGLFHKYDIQDYKIEPNGEKKNPKIEDKLEKIVSAVDHVSD